MKSLAELQASTLYLDSNVFIYAFEGEDGRVRKTAGQLLQYIQARHAAAATSLLTRAEVLVRPLRLKQIELADRYRALLSGASGVGLYGVDENVVDRAAELRADYPVLKLPDALHIATALHIGCDFFVTGDRHLSIVSARISVLTLDQLAST
jgi:predicted nucleic acid-binding protein